MPDQEKSSTALSFPLQLVIQIVSIAIVIAGFLWGMRADQREVLVIQRMQAERLEELNKKYEMLRLDVQDINVALARAGIDRKGH